VRTEAKHGKKEIFETEVQPEGFKVCRTRDARIQARQIEIRPQWEKSEEPQAGHRHRAIRSAQGRREGATGEEKIRKEKELQQIELEEKVQLAEEVHGT
jgi:hypothetical protein